MKTFIQDICREAAEITWQHFGDTEVLYTKEGVSDVVTKADIASHQHCLARIQKAFPDHVVVSEESENASVEAEHVWIIDPLDGSRNFSTSTPLFGTMVAYVRAGEVLLSAIYLPFSRELYFAEKGAGAFLNGKRISCAQKTAWNESYGVGCVNFESRHQVWNDLATRMIAHRPFWMGLIGSVAVEAAWVASGRRDWWVTPAGSVWDTSAPALLLSEAGCTVTDMAGKPWAFGAKGIVAANKTLHDEIIRLIQE
ncbi:MAG: inositol monophosphatase [Patescibacteria group bacterium]|jgi:myo-inositol-1(or 4)-monophosphatase